MCHKSRLMFRLRDDIAKYGMRPILQSLQTDVAAIAPPEVEMSVLKAELHNGEIRKWRIKSDHLI